ncbi:Protein of unknown function (DUF1779) [Desulfosporosinus acidiphilus SJ4]|uniref:Uncharacterized protein n=1 Tax=Desulfosporosinus acidiphilus (strain DSM 22704 / JCM 16185 / SJ4) TaxID=646529 RepID=I4DCD4_DESAJ|nr:Protein of unknown function (DUF1779) [Desulfosporosinus acidiphilus SJ4]
MKKIINILGKNVVKKHSNVGILVVCILLMLCLKTNVLMAQNTMNDDGVSNKSIPLLLNSKFVDASEARVTMVIWFDDSNRPLSSEQITNPPVKNWSWSNNYLQAGNSRRASTISGEGLVNKKEELKVYKWYTIMAPKIAKAGGRMYLDERVPESIDIPAYLNHIDAQPVQWAISDNLISIAAYQKLINPSVKIGTDKLNIQILSRGEAAKGETVLAIPVLLEEF